MELWAAIDLLGGSVVTLKQGRESNKTSWRQKPEEVASRWEREGADGLHIIDLDAAFGKGGEGGNRKVIGAIVRNAGIPVEVGGGVKTQEVAESLLDSGASRVILGTMAYTHPRALKALLASRGAESIVVAADYSPSGEVMVKGWTSGMGVTVFEAAREFEGAGVANLLTTSVGRDGMAQGPDTATITRLCAGSKMRILGSGGIRDLKDLESLAKAGAAGAVIGRALYDGGVELEQAKRRLRSG
jgi:phosphoribosylformimino-5-aminoimidazole carboxamide ribotide isomerase